MTTGLEKVSFHSNPKERKCQKCSNYSTITFISHASKIMLKILQARLQQYMNCELPDVQAGCRKVEKAHGAIKVDILLTELDRGGWGEGGAEWALPLPVLRPVTRPGEQISFADHCVLCVTPRSILKCIQAGCCSIPVSKGDLERNKIVVLFSAPFAPTPPLLCP